MPVKIKKTPEGVYRALTDGGNVLNSSSSAAQAVLQSAFDQSGDIWIGPGDWNWNDIVPVKIKKKTHVYADPKAAFIAMNGYSGDMFLIETATDANAGSVWDVVWRGGDFKEAGPTPAYNSNPFHILSNTANKGIFDISIEYARAYYNSNVAVLMETTDIAAWITDCNFIHNFWFGPRVGFEMRKVAGAPYNYINRCNFMDNTIQSGSNTLWGFKGMDGDSQEFYNNIVYDKSLGAPGIKHSQFLSTVKNHIIMGGYMTGVVGTDWERLCPEKEITIIDAPTSTANFKALKTPSLTMVPPQEGIYTLPTSNDGKTRTFAIPHGLGVTPTVYKVEGVTIDALVGPLEITSVDATNINISYTGIIPPPTTPGRPGHLKWFWRAKP